MMLFFVIRGQSFAEEIELRHPAKDDRQKWIMHPANPVFQPSPPLWFASFPCVLFDPFRFGSGEGSPYYKLWFDSAKGLYYADSTNGVDWRNIRPAGTGLTTPMQGKMLYDLKGFGGMPYCYRIWFADARGDPRAPLRTAQSRDGWTWENETEATGVYVKDHPWSQRGYGVISILYHPQGSDRVILERPLQNRYVLFYDCFILTGKGMEEIALAVSADGVNFTICGNGPVVPCGGRPSKVWDRDYATCGSVIEGDDGLLRIWYSGGQNENVELLFSGIGFAVSRDGLHWEKSPHNPILAWKKRIWDSGTCAMPQVIYDKAHFRATGEKNGLSYKMWYGGSTNSLFFKPEWQVGIGLAQLWIPETLQAPKLDDGTP